MVLALSFGNGTLILPDLALKVFFRGTMHKSTTDQMNVAITWLRRDGAR